MLTLKEGLGLRQIAARILHELALGVRAAEAVGIALDRRIDGAIRLHVLVIGETPGTHVAELAGHRIGRTGKADDEYAGYEILFHFGRSFRFGRPPVTYRAICGAAPRRAWRSSVADDFWREAVALKRYRSHPMMLIGDKQQSYPRYRDIALVPDRAVDGGQSADGRYQ
jgi:hypothetical protein